MAKYCADCRDMGEVPNKKGLFPCLNCRKSGHDEVSARQLACRVFTEAFNSRRSESERERLMRISRDHGYYITTFIVETLDLEDKDEYIGAFAYLKDEVIPRLDTSRSWVNDYDTYGPIVAERLIQSENPVDRAQSLFYTYLRPFKELIETGEIMAAARLYDKMYQELKQEFNLLGNETPNTGANTLRR